MGAMQACINYADQLGSSCGYDDLSASGTVHRIFTTERDILMCQQLQLASQHKSHCIVGIVGAAHVPGICEYWHEDTISAAADVVNQPFPDATETFQGSDGQSGCQPGMNASKVPETSKATSEGVRRALLERFIELSCDADLWATMRDELAPLQPEAQKAYEHVQEIYGSHRMLLAALPEEHLAKVQSRQ